MKLTLNLRQSVAVSFAAGVVGALAVVLFSLVLNLSGVGPALGVDAPSKFSPPDIYRPLFWGGLWGIPFGFLLRKLWDRLTLAGFLYFLAPVAALYLIFSPMRGTGLFGLDKGPGFTLYLALVNTPYGIVTAMTVRWLAGGKSGWSHKG